MGMAFTIEGILIRSCFMALACRRGSGREGCSIRGSRGMAERNMLGVACFSFRMFAGL